jgi:hypothetical protein
MLMEAERVIGYLAKYAKAGPLLTTLRTDELLVFNLEVDPTSIGSLSA